MAARSVHVASPPLPLGEALSGREGAYIARWSLPMRLVHWTLALSFLGLLSSGLALEFPDLRGIPFLGSKLVRELHLTLALLLFVLPAVAAAWDGFHEVATLWTQARTFVVRVDGAWLLGIGLRMLGRPDSLPPQGFFNAGQKLNVLIVGALLCGLTLTGVLLAPEAGRPVPQTVREAVYPIHQALAYCTIPILLAHVLLATLWPATRPALRGMLLGCVRRDWARSHHALWLAETPKDTPFRVPG